MSEIDKQKSACYYLYTFFLFLYIDNISPQGGERGLKSRKISAIFLIKKVKEIY